MTWTKTKAVTAKTTDSDIFIKFYMKDDGSGNALFAMLEINSTNFGKESIEFKVANKVTENQLSALIALLRNLRDSGLSDLGYINQ